MNDCQSQGAETVGIHTERREGEDGQGRHRRLNLGPILSNHQIPLRGPGPAPLLAHPDCSLTLPRAAPEEGRKCPEQCGKAGMHTGLKEECFHPDSVTEWLCGLDLTLRRSRSSHL